MYSKVLRAEYSVYCFTADKDNAFGHTSYSDVSFLASLVTVLVGSAPAYVPIHKVGKGAVPRAAVHFVPRALYIKRMQHAMLLACCIQCPLLAACDVRVLQQVCF